MTLHYQDYNNGDHTFNMKDSTYEKIIAEFGSIGKYLDSIGVHYNCAWVTE